MDRREPTDPRREAFSAILERTALLLKFRMHLEYPGLSPPGTPGDIAINNRDLTIREAINAARRLTFPLYNVISPFRVNCCEVPLKEAESFFLQWKIANPYAVPSDRYHLRCLADAVDAVSSDHYYPRDEFVVRVSENFDAWKESFHS